MQTCGEDDEKVEKLSEGDVATLVLIDDLEEVHQEERLWLHAERLGKLVLGQFATTDLGCVA